MMYNQVIRPQGLRAERMIVIKKTKCILVLIALAIGLTGCNWRVSPEELLEPPKLFEEDERISSMLEESLSEDAKLENISSDQGLSAVKKSDIDGDGKNEVLVFYSKEQEGSLHMSVFEESGGSYEVVLEEEVPGRLFEEMMLADVTGDGLKELVINTSDKRYQAGRYKMSIYSYRKDPNKLFEIDYSKYVIYDLDKNGSSDIIILNQEERAISVDYYSFNRGSGQMEFISEDLLDKREVVDMSAVEREDGNARVALEFYSQTEEMERVFLELDAEGKLKSEEED